jgi:nucleoside-diphosphate-sugar epimerase
VSASTAGAVDDLSGRVVLVTGGAGFIGSHLVDGLVAAGARVRVLDDFSSGRAENLVALGDRIEVLAGDVRDVATCRRACEGVDLVFHLAAVGSVPRSLRDPVTTFDVNAGGTAHMLAAAYEAGSAAVVAASSSSVYGDVPGALRVEGTEGEPLSPYALSKRVGEELAASFRRCFGLAVVSLRFFNVFGPRQRSDGPYAAVIPRFVEAARRGMPLEIHGDGEQSRDFTYVADVVAGCLLAARAAQRVAGRTLNVGAGGRVSLNELATRIKVLTGSASAIVHGPPRAGDVRTSRADLKAVGAALGYAPLWSFEGGLRATIAAWP